MSIPFSWVTSFAISSPHVATALNRIRIEDWSNTTRTYPYDYLNELPVYSMMSLPTLSSPSQLLGHSLNCSSPIIISQVLTPTSIITDSSEEPLDLSTKSTSLKNKILFNNYSNDMDYYKEEETFKLSPHSGILDTDSLTQNGSKLSPTPTKVSKINQPFTKVKYELLTDNSLLTSSPPSKSQSFDIHHIIPKADDNILPKSQGLLALETSTSFSLPIIKNRCYSQIHEQSKPYKKRRSVIEDEKCYNCNPEIQTKIKSEYTTDFSVKQILSPIKLRELPRYCKTEPTEHFNLLISPITLKKLEDNTYKFVNEPHQRRSFRSKIFSNRNLHKTLRYPKRYKHLKITKKTNQISADLLYLVCFELFEKFIKTKSINNLDFSINDHQRFNSLPEEDGLLRLAEIACQLDGRQQLFSSISSKITDELNNTELIKNVINNEKQFQKVFDQYCSCIQYLRRQRYTRICRKRISSIRCGSYKSINVLPRQKRHGLIQLYYSPHSLLQSDEKSIPMGYPLLSATMNFVLLNKRRNSIHNNCLLEKFEIEPTVSDIKKNTSIQLLDNIENIFNLQTSCSDVETHQSEQLIESDKCLPDVIVDKDETINNEEINSIERLVPTDPIEDGLKVLIANNGLMYEAVVNRMSNVEDMFLLRVLHERTSIAYVLSLVELCQIACKNSLPTKDDIKIGRRVCCYWSSCLKGLHPGIINRLPSEPNGMIAVLFDDNDFGLLKLEEIRLLPNNFQIKGNDLSIYSISSSQISSLYTVKRSIKKPSSCSHHSDKSIETDFLPSSQSLCRQRSTKSHSSGTSNQKSVLNNISVPPSTTNDNNTDLISTSSTSMEIPLKITTTNPGSWSFVEETRCRTITVRRVKQTLYRSISRGDELVTIGDCVIFNGRKKNLSYIGKVLKFYQTRNEDIVKVSWYYSPQETSMGLIDQDLPGALYESNHTDVNLIHTIHRRATIYSYSDFIKRTSFGRLCNENEFYLVGHYDPITQGLERYVLNDMTLHNDDIYDDGILPSKKCTESTVRK
ncbi:unnamed protein product [Didymodactylos carnosus]|uniref:BAH domain-containing protein n=1 Tax=Didymodactylos carnosus TaxID=1234261 RepID=A0A8S2DKH1_9BILA|nr:unnamed protein product [Didymodactylos carnosus]CAF3707947.1 unnamed protein product [Didymodactylos carnosus]